MFKKRFLQRGFGKIIKSTESEENYTNTLQSVNNAQVEVVNKTIAQYLKRQVDTNTHNWELYLVLMAFTFNTTLDRTIKSQIWFKCKNNLF
jgi:hypothetical protein